MRANGRSAPDYCLHRGGSVPQQTRHNRRVPPLGPGAPGRRAALSPSAARCWTAYYSCP